VQRKNHETRPEPIRLPLDERDYELIRSYVTSGVSVDRLAWNQAFVKIVRRLMVLERRLDLGVVSSLYQRLLTLRKSNLLPAIHHRKIVPLTYGPSRIGSPCDWETHLQRLEVILDGVGIPYYRVGLYDRHTRLRDVGRASVSV
jgi:hypothetical protein